MEYRRGVHGVLHRTIYPLLRRVEFRGKRRLRRFAPVPQSGRQVICIGGGLRVELDLSEPLQRDYYFGLFDLFELKLVRRILSAGGDFIDVGSYIGVYSLAAAQATTGRVLAFEPHPGAREQLARNLQLNDSDVIIVAGAAGGRPGRATLHVASDGDPSWSTMEDDGRFGSSDTGVSVSVSTVDDEVARHGLAPALVKIDVEGRELDVAAGMEATLAASPTLLVEVSRESAAALETRLRPIGYQGFRIERSKLVPGAVGAGGIYNALFVPSRHASLVG
jgi:FkbM family methyltransferase